MTRKEIFHIDVNSAFLSWETRNRIQSTPFGWYLRRKLVSGCLWNYNYNIMLVGKKEQSDKENNI